MSRTYRKSNNKPYKHCRKFQSRTQNETNRAYNETRKIFHRPKPRGRVRNLREYLGHKVDKRELEVDNLQYKIRTRTCPLLIWDDKLSSGFIKKLYH